MEVEDTQREGDGNRERRGWEQGEKGMGTGREGDGKRERRGWEQGERRGNLETWGLEVGDVERRELGTRRHGKKGVGSRRHGNGN